ncbi:hypothetical protein MTR67_044658 [Solanum verrucosum]|uniref:Uncharacterized protein n=1 Tax=Solanum verrucosum TaxID=315347 RepID=A0AAF0ZVG8_SOLVR|nr:hypothetical protein MTR67_044658 [Solanum verrucosum]
MNTRSMAICCTAVKVVCVRKLVKLQSTSPIRSDEVVCTLGNNSSWISIVGSVVSVLAQLSDLRLWFYSLEQVGFHIKLIVNLYFQYLFFTVYYCNCVEDLVPSI